MADLSNYDFSGSAFSSGPLPDGEYNVEVIGSQVNANEDKVRLSLICNVLEGEYEGRRLYLDFWLRHPSDGARKVSIGQFKMVCKALGYQDVPGDSSELHGNTMTVRTTLYQDKYINIKSAKPIASAGAASDPDNPF